MAVLPQEYVAELGRELTEKEMGGLLERWPELSSKFGYPPIRRPRRPRHSHTKQKEEVVASFDLTITPRKQQFF